MTDYRANYALVSFQEHLGPDEDGMDVPWASFAGDETAPHTFEVPSTDVRDAYLEMQVYDVGSYEHDVLINGQALSGFDVPTGEGWQYWMDTVTVARLTAGENTIQFRRDSETDDHFVVGTVTVHWREPAE